MNNVHFTDVKKSGTSVFSINDAGKYVYFLSNYSGTLDVHINEKNVEVYIFGLYFGSGNQKFEVKTTQHHNVGESVSDLLIKGVFDDSSKFIYEGLIKIEKNAQKSNAYQKNQNIVLSDNVFVDSRPFLEIEANDVRCTHGSTTGRPDKEQLYYIQSRGIDEHNSRKLVIDGFLAEVTNRMKIVGIDTQEYESR